jgi:predicted anti-sigma-YlaC factor YlaD
VRVYLAQGLISSRKVGRVKQGGWRDVLAILGTLLAGGLAYVVAGSVVMLALVWFLINVPSGPLLIIGYLVAVILFSIAIIIARQ